MFIPEKAIICAPTNEDADLLFQFLGEHGYKFGARNAKEAQSTGWDCEKSNTCYNLEQDKHICFSSREYYEAAVQRYRAGYGDEDDLQYMPDSPEWIFISVQDFIAKCNGCESIQDIEIEDMTSIL